ncbi:hypothetical protein [Solimicrobium silvestre]|uniref:Uncharacterized protein n=1 Tax=Solimicrobium silvestre TaxID=2099400 RepID=A0A2S9GS72_9BURK|nr:hypothetical protein [Solimicrobium silvestre]PRC90559.1 hypothetical protein S2091_4733 [Solimicrobium silvestre]
MTLGSSLAGAIGSVITRIGDQVTKAQNTDNDRLKGALALKAGYDTYKLVNGGKVSETTTESLKPNPQNSGDGFGVSVNLGVSRSQQDSNNSATQARGTRSKPARSTSPPEKVTSAWKVPNCKPTISP